MIKKALVGAVLLALLGCATTPTPTLDCRSTAEECRAFEEDRERTAEGLKPKPYPMRRQPYACALVGVELVCAMGVVGF